MSAFLVILGVPLVGVLLIVAERIRREGQTPRVRSLARIGLLMCGVGAALTGVIILADVAMWIVAGVLDRSMLMAVIKFIAMTSAGMLMVWAARCAWRVSQLPAVSYDGAVEPKQERASEQLRLSATLLLFVPLLMLGVFGVLLAVPLVLWGVAYRTMRMARQAQFLWTLALAVRQDLTLPEEIELFAEPLGSRQRAVYRSLANRLRDGRSLGEALELTPGILSRSVASEIRAAEDAGRLSEALSDLATRTTTSLSRNRVDGSFAIAILYGWMLLSLFLIVVGFLMYWIIPKYKDIFHDFGFELPPMTISVIETSNSLLDNFLLVMPLIGLPILLAIVVSAVYVLRWDNLNLPLLMRWFPRLDAPSLLRTLSHVVGARSPLPETLDEMSLRHLRTDVRQRMRRMSDALERGEPLWTSLCEEGFIRPVEATALEAAQRVGNLPWAMQTLADSMDRAVRRRAQFWLEVLKPAVVICVGFVVGWFVIAMFLPLVQLIVSMS